MIYTEILRHHETKIKNGMKELFDVAESNQTHQQDILLILEHGFYNEFYETYRNKEGKKFSPYVIGPNDIGLSEKTHYNYINAYRHSNMVNIPYDEFEKKTLESEELKAGNEFSIQMEKNIYLRIWESDMLIKNLYQLSKLALGESYDWHFEVENQKRDGNSKQKLIRKEIRDKLKSICPNFYEILDNCYWSQIRNAVAHSQFYILGRNITYLNYSDNPKAGAPFKGLSFSGWAHMFHKTILFHNELIRNFNFQQEKYYKHTKENKELEVRIIKEDKSIEHKFLVLRREDLKTWVWKK